MFQQQGILVTLGAAAGWPRPHSPASGAGWLVDGGRPCGPCIWVVLCLLSSPAFFIAYD